MFNNLLLKTFYDKRWFVVGWSVGLVFMVLLVITFYPSFSENGLFEELSESAPPQFKELIGDASTYQTITGYVSQQLFDTRVTLLFMIMAIILGLSLSVGEEEKGVLRTLVATRLSRVRIALEKWLAAVLIMGAASIAVVVGILIGLLFINESMDAGLLLKLGLLAWLFGSAAVAIPLGLGFVTGNRSLTMGVAVVATIGSFILSTFGKAVDWLESFEFLSLMHYFETVKIVKEGVQWGDVGVMSTIFVIMLAAGLIVFRYRDIS